MTALSNSTALLAQRDEYFASVDKFAAQEALGVDSRPNWLKATVRAAHNGVIAADESKAIYERYIERVSKKAAHLHKSLSVRASELKEIITYAGLNTVDAVAVIDGVQDIIRDRRDAKLASKTFWQSTLAISKKQNANAKIALTADEIEACIATDEKEKTLLTDLEADYKRLFKRVAEAEKADGGAADYVKDALASVGNAIVEAGGELPAMSKDEKKLRAAMILVAQAQSQGSLQI